MVSIRPAKSVRVYSIIKQVSNALKNIKIGWEIEGVGDDAFSIRLKCEGRCSEFEKVE